MGQTTTRQEYSRLNKLLTAFRAGMKLSRSAHNGYTVMRGKTCYACAIGTVLLGAKLRKIAANGDRIARKDSLLGPTGQVNAMLPE